MAEEVIHAPKTEQATVPLESDISRLAGEFAKHKENPEMSGASEREIVKEAIRSVVVAPAPKAPQANVADDSVLPAYMSGATPATKLEVEDFIRMAFKEGIAKATNAAQKSNPFVLDAFHDALAGKLHEELKKRKLI